MPERPRRLVHFSEDPFIARFYPHVATTSNSMDELVWALQPDRSYLYLFPRECPRVAFRGTVETSDEDVRNFLLGNPEHRVVAIEAKWLRGLREAQLYRYDLASEGFELEDENAGYWVSRAEAVPLSVSPVGDLMTALIQAGVELRILPTLWPLYDAVVMSTLGFSVIRMRNAMARSVEVTGE